MATEGASTSKSTNKKNAPTRFFPALDILLLRALVAVQPTTKPPWDEVHQHVNTALTEVKRDSFVTLRACKDRVKTLQEAHTKDELKSLRASGTDEEYDERAQLLTELASLSEERAAKKQEEKPDLKEAQGRPIRQAAMETLKVRDDPEEHADGFDRELDGADENLEHHGKKAANCTTKPATKKRRTDSAEYVTYLKDKLSFEKERFEVEKKEREARIQRDQQMMEMMMALDKNKN
ncbi:uncharacterized protein LOC135494419 [Lineus longissimus]|uniref:uncharacterized protein LOC135494419 n=1 Tax=Lineus longissimus TaxID=88925 RepID=UPI00315D0FFB